MAERYDVAIVGGGAIGLAAACALTQAGRRVLVVDRGREGGAASEASAGMLAAQVEHAGGGPLRFAVAARERHLALASACAQRGRAYALSTGGILVIALDEERARELRALAGAQRDLDLEAAWLPRSELTRRQPGVSRTARGAFLSPRDGCVDSVGLCAALEALARAGGATLVRGEVRGLETRAGRASGIRTADAALAAGVVVLAAGAWTGGLQGLPRPVPVEPVRGQMAETAWPAGEPRGVLFGPEAYVVPRGERALLGSTMEHVGFRPGTTEEGLARIRRGAAALLPALAGAPFTRTWSGLRPMSPDGLPIIGLDPDVEGLIYATGHGRNGILLAAITGEIVRDLVVRGDTTWDIETYSIRRFDGGGHAARGSP